MITTLFVPLSRKMLKNAKWNGIMPFDVKLKSSLKKRPMNLKLFSVSKPFNVQNVTSIFVKEI
jgi:hypothetical protein